LSDIRDEKTKMRSELDPKSREYEEWFLNYIPNKTKKAKQNITKKNKSKKNKSKKNKSKKN
jgi:hypothetical protein